MILSCKQVFKEFGAQIEPLESTGEQKLVASQLEKEKRWQDGTQKTREGNQERKLYNSRIS